MARGGVGDLYRRGGEFSLHRSSLYRGGERDRARGGGGE